MGAKNAKFVKNDAPLAERLMEEGEIRHHHDMKSARLKEQRKAREQNYEPRKHLGPGEREVVADSPVR